jgi:protoporphyrinogen oxidase
MAQKKTETSLIEKFLYPKFGPGQLWEHAAELVKAGGGEIHHGDSHRPHHSWKAIAWFG